MGKGESRHRKSRQRTQGPQLAEMFGYAGKDRAGQKENNLSHRKVTVCKKKNGPKGGDGNTMTGKETPDHQHQNSGLEPSAQKTNQTKGWWGGKKQLGSDSPTKREKHLCKG